MKINRLFLIAILLYGCRPNEKKTPEIFFNKHDKSKITQVEFYPSSFIFDTLMSGKEYEGKFYIINRGKNNLVIDSVLKSCSCTSANIDKVIIVPKDSFEYRFKIKPAEKNGYFVSTLMFHMNTKPYFRQYIIEGYSY